MDLAVVVSLLLLQLLLVSSHLTGCLALVLLTGRAPGQRRHHALLRQWQQHPVPISSTLASSTTSVASTPCVASLRRQEAFRRHSVSDVDSKMSRDDQPSRKEETINMMEGVAANGNADSPNADLSLHAALAARIESLKDGVGKRYICRTQRGFLNVHDAPGDPFDSSNLVGRLVEGQVVTSTGPAQTTSVPSSLSPSNAETSIMVEPCCWVPHDGGGWSVAQYGGFVWLQPLSE